MSDVLFYATADTHAPEEADGGAWRSLRAVRGDAVYGIARLAALCLEDGVPMVIAGDLFDGPDPAPDAQGAVYEALAPMLKAGLGVYYNLGNHDRGRDWLAPLARLGLPVRRVDGNVYRDPAGFTVTGLSYVPPASFAEAVKAVQPVDVGLYHQQWAEWAGGGGRVSTASLPAHRVAVCGDVHVHALIEGKGGPTLALSPGPLPPQWIVEFGRSRASAVGREIGDQRRGAATEPALPQQEEGEGRLPSAVGMLLSLFDSVELGLPVGVPRHARPSNGRRGMGSKRWYVGKRAATGRPREPAGAAVPPPLLSGVMAPAGSVRWRQSPTSSRP